jgi:hypothetical protein
VNVNELIEKVVNGQDPVSVINEEYNNAELSAFDKEAIKKFSLLEKPLNSLKEAFKKVEEDIDKIYGDNYTDMKQKSRELVEKFKDLVGVLEVELMNAQKGTEYKVVPKTYPSKYGY